MITQNLAQKQRLKILPQQIQLLNFFQLNSLELEHRIQQELEENPILEEKKDEDPESADKYAKDDVQDYQGYDEYEYDDIPDYKLEYRNYLPDEKSINRPVADITDFRKDIKQQFQLVAVNERELLIGYYIIDSLDENGLLSLDIEQLAEDYSFKNNIWLETEEIVLVLCKIQTLDPVGVGSRDIGECLLMQLERMNTKRPDVKKAIALIKNYYGDLKSRNLEKIKDQLEIDEEELKIILQLLSSLKMKPVAESAHSMVNPYIAPDFIITYDGNDLEVQLYRQRANNLFINTTWKQDLETSLNASKDKDTVQYLKNKLQSAQWFISAVKEREHNMLRVMKAIVDMQRAYFIDGDIRLLRPMILKNIAEQVGLDISTVSRITSNKYAETHFGTILLKNLFTEGIINGEGKAISNKVIQNAIEEVVDAEDKKTPYTDQQLVTILADKGFAVARRTVAKYREQLHIPVAQLRSVWA